MFLSFFNAHANWPNLLMPKGAERHERVISVLAYYKATLFPSERFFMDSAYFFPNRINLRKSFSFCGDDIPRGNRVFFRDDHPSELRNHRNDALLLNVQQSGPILLYRARPLGIWGNSRFRFPVAPSSEEPNYTSGSSLILLFSKTQEMNRVAPNFSMAPNGIGGIMNPSGGEFRIWGEELYWNGNGKKGLGKRMIHPWLPILLKQANHHFCLSGYLLR